MLPSEAHICFSSGHIFASARSTSMLFGIKIMLHHKKHRFDLLLHRFAFARSTTVFFMKEFFHASIRSRRHICASASSTTVLLEKEKVKKVASGSGGFLPFFCYLFFFCCFFVCCFSIFSILYLIFFWFSTFFMKNSSVKPISMRSNFEDLGRRNPTMMIVWDLSAQFRI